MFFNFVTSQATASLILRPFGEKIMENMEGFQFTRHITFNTIIQAFIFRDSGW